MSADGVCAISAGPAGHETSTSVGPLAILPVAKFSVSLFRLLELNRTAGSQLFILGARELSELDRTRDPHP